MEKNPKTKQLAKFKWENLTLVRYHSYSNLDNVDKKRQERKGWARGIKESLDPSSGEWSVDKVIHNVDEQEWIKLSLDPSHEASTKRLTLVLEQEGDDKVRLGVYKFQKLRPIGKKYFHKHRDNYYVTFNLKTGDFYYTTSTFYRRRKSTLVNKNPLISTPSPKLSYDEILSFMKIPNLNITTTDKAPYLKTAVAKSQIQVEIASALNHILSQLYFNLLSDDYSIDELEEQFKSCFGFQSTITLDAANFHYVIHLMSAAWFVKNKNIKCPNLWGYMLTTFYPGMRKIKRNKMKLVAATLDYYGIKNKSNIGFFNQNPDLSYPEYAALQKVLGVDFIKYVNSSYFHKDTKEYKEQRDGLLPFYGTTEESKNWVDGQGLTNSEKRNIIKVLNDERPITSKGPTKLRWTELMDHLNQQYTLNTKYDENVKIRAKTLDEFNTEHSDWATKLHYHQSNLRTTLTHDKILIESIPGMVNVEGTKYYPVLLKDDLDYFQEGQHQVNCVRSYLDTPNCYIISIRKNSPDGHERATCEFRYDGVNLNPQNRLKRNSILNESWERVIDDFKSVFYYNIKTSLSEGKYLTTHNKQTRYVKASIPFELEPDGHTITYPRLLPTVNVWDHGDLPF